MISRILFSLLIVAFFLVAACSLSAKDSSEPTDHEILKKADEARGNVGGVSW